MNRNDDWFARTRLWIKEAIKKRCPTLLDDTCLFVVALNLVCTVLLAIIFEAVTEYSAVKCEHPKYEIFPLKRPLTVIIGFVVLLFGLLKCLNFQEHRIGLICLHVIFFASIMVPIKYFPSYEDETTFGFVIEKYKETNIVSPNSIIDIIARMNSTGQAYKREPLKHDKNFVLQYLRTQLNIVTYSSILSWVFFVCLFISYHVKDFKQSQRALPPPTPRSGASSRDASSRDASNADAAGPTAAQSPSDQKTSSDPAAIDNACAEVSAPTARRPLCRAFSDSSTTESSTSERMPLVSPLPTSQSSDPATPLLKLANDMPPNFRFSVVLEEARKKAVEIINRKESGHSVTSSSTSSESDQQLATNLHYCYYNDETNTCEKCNQVQYSELEEETEETSFQQLIPQTDPSQASSQGRRRSRPIYCCRCRAKFYPPRI